MCAGNRAGNSFSNASTAALSVPAGKSTRYAAAGAGRAGGGGGRAERASEERIWRGTGGGYTRAGRCSLRFLTASTLLAFASAAAAATMTREIWDRIFEVGLVTRFGRFSSCSFNGEATHGEQGGRLEAESSTGSVAAQEGEEESAPGERGASVSMRDPKSSRKSSSSRRSTSSGRP